MSKFTKRQFDKIADQASAYALEKDYDNAWALTDGEVNQIDLNLTSGKYVEELRNLSYHYQRMVERA